MVIPLMLITQHVGTARKITFLGRIPFMVECWHARVNLQIDVPNEWLVTQVISKFIKPIYARGIMRKNVWHGTIY